MPEPILESLSVETPDVVGQYQRPVVLKLTSVIIEGTLPRKILRIETSAGAAISGATVTFTDSSSTLLATLTSDASGEVFSVLDSNVSNPLTMVITAAGYPTYTSTVTMEDDTFFEIALFVANAPLYFITVEDVDGNALENATVTLTDNNGTLVSGSTDASGQVARSLYAGLVNPFEMSISKSGYLTYHAVVSLFDGTDYEIALPPSSEIAPIPGSPSQSQLGITLKHEWIVSASLKRHWIISIALRREWSETGE